MKGCGGDAGWLHGNSLGSHLKLWRAASRLEFSRSLGHGDVNFQRRIIRELNNIGYDGPLSVEWEDNGMDREFAADVAADFVSNVDFPPSAIAFDAAFDN